MKRMMKLIMILGLLALLATPAAAEKMIFVSGGQSPPLVYEENGKVVGMDVDVINLFCEKNGITPEYQVYPWKRAIMMVERGDAQGVFSLFRTPEREGFLYYPEATINEVRTLVIGRKDATFQVAGVDDLAGKMIGVVREYKYGPEIDNRADLNKAVCKDKREMINLLHNGRVDAILNSDMVFQYECRQYGFNAADFKVLSTIRTNPIYVGFSRAGLGEKGQKLAEAFSPFIRELEKSGELEQIRNRYR